MTKTYFVTGATGTGVNVYELADHSGMLDSPGMIAFTIVFGLIMCLLGGITLVVVSKWVNKMIEKAWAIYDKKLLK